LEENLLQYTPLVIYHSIIGIYTSCGEANLLNKQTQNRKTN